MWPHERATLQEGQISLLKPLGVGASIKFPFHWGGGEGNLLIAESKNDQKLKHKQKLTYNIPGETNIGTMEGKKEEHEREIRMVKDILVLGKIQISVNFNINREI